MPNLDVIGQTLIDQLNRPVNGDALEKTTAQFDVRGGDLRGCLLDHLSGLTGQLFGVRRRRGRRFTAVARRLGNAEHGLKVSFDVGLNLILQSRTGSDQDEATAQVRDHVSRRGAQLLFVRVEKEILSDDRLGRTGRHFQRALNGLQTFVDRLFDRRMNVGLQAGMMLKEKNVGIDLQHRTQRLKDRRLEIRELVLRNWREGRGTPGHLLNGDRHCRRRRMKVDQRGIGVETLRRRRVRPIDIGQLFLEFLEILLIVQHVMDGKVLRSTRLTSEGQWNTALTFS